MDLDNHWTAALDNRGMPNRVAVESSTQGAAVRLPLPTTSRSLAFDADKISRASLAKSPITQPLLSPTTRASWYADLAFVLETLGVQTWSKLRVLDVGCADAAFIAAIASVGADASGLEKAGVQVSDAENKGNIRVHRGSVREIVGETFDLVVSRNTLKKGFIRPDAGTPMIKLGADSCETLTIVHDALSAGGIFCIYNVSPTDVASASQPHADGRCPFTEAELKASGFDVLCHDADLTPLTRATARSLGIEALSASIKTLCTLVRKPR